MYDPPRGRLHGALPGPASPLSVQRKAVKENVSVLVVGMSHRSAPVALLERLSMDETVRHDTTSQLVERPSLSEAMIVSTCNRLEIYSVTNSFHSGVQDVV